MPVENLQFKATLDGKPFIATITTMEGRAKSSAASIFTAYSTATSALATVGSKIAAAFTAPVDAIANGTREVFDYTRSLAQLSDQTGASVGSLFALGREFENAGLEADDAGAAINRMQRFLHEGGEGGNEKIFDSLRLLGLNFLDIRRLSPEHQFQAIGTAIAKLGDSTARGAASMEIFGKSGGRLLRVFNDPAFKNGGDLTGRAAILQKNAELFEQTSIRLNRAGDLFKSFYTGIAVQTATPLDNFLGHLEKVDLTGLGERFGGKLVEGATGVVDMLLALRKADIVGIAAGFEARMKRTYGWVTAIGGTMEKIDAFAAKLGLAVAGIPSMVLNPPEIEKVARAKPPEPEITADPVTVTGRTSLFQHAGMHFQTHGMRFDEHRYKTGTTYDESPPLFPHDFDETRNVGLQTGSLRTEGLNTGTLFGDGSDTAEGYRQSSKALRDTIQFNNPLLSGGALNSAVRQEQRKQRNEQRIQDFRDKSDREHPGQAEARAAKEAAARGATSADVGGTTKAVGEIGGKLDAFITAFNQLMGTGGGGASSTGGATPASQ